MNCMSITRLAGERLDIQMMSHYSLPLTNARSSCHHESTTSRDTARLRSWVGTFCIACPASDPTCWLTSYCAGKLNPTAQKLPSGQKKWRIRPVPADWTKASWRTWSTVAFRSTVYFHKAPYARVHPVSAIGTSSRLNCSIQNTLQCHRGTHHVRYLRKMLLSNAN